MLEEIKCLEEVAECDLKGKDECQEVYDKLIFDNRRKSAEFRSVKESADKILTKVEYETN
jgi:hypothetical protein